MKKLLSAALAFAFFLFCCGCNSAKPTVKEIKSALTESGAFSAEENLIALDTKEIEERFGFSSDILDGFSVLVSKTENEVEQFGVFTLKDNDDLNTVIDAIKQYLKPVTVDDTNKAAVSPHIVLMQTENSVIFAATTETALAAEALDSLGAKEIK